MNIRRHLIPFFGKLRLTELEERHLLQFIREKTDPRPPSLDRSSASTLQNILSVLRRVLTLAVDEGELDRNPCRNLGKLLAKVKRQQSEEVAQVDSWSREEVATLLEIARDGGAQLPPAPRVPALDGLPQGRGAGRSSGRTWTSRARGS